VPEPNHQAEHEESGAVDALGGSESWKLLFHGPVASDRLRKARVRNPDRDRDLRILKTRVIRKLGAGYGFRL